MKIQTQKTPTIEELYSLLKKEFPEYEVNIRSNIFAEYVQVKKSAFIGAWIFSKKNNITVNGAIPSALVRALFGGVLLIAFIYRGLKRVENEVGNLLATKSI